MQKVQRQIALYRENQTQCKRKHENLSTELEQTSVYTPEISQGIDDLRQQAEALNIRDDATLEEPILRESVWANITKSSIRLFSMDSIIMTFWNLKIQI